MHLSKFQSSEELVVLLNVRAAGTKVYLCDIRPEGKQRSEDGNDHEAIIPARVLVVRLEKLVGKIKDGCFFIVDEVVKRLIELTGDDKIEIVYLLGHQDTKLLIQFASFQIILLKRNASVASFKDHDIHIACDFRKEASLFFLPLLNPYILDDQLYFL